MFNTGEDIKNYQKKYSSLKDNIYYYLNIIFQNLLIREESPHEDINEFNNKNIFSNTVKQKANEKGISFRNFLQYFDIQEFMCERIFNYLDKSKTEKLTKNEFVNGLFTIYFGNITDLYNVAFCMCDFNEKNKIHKFNMKLILSYIPFKTYEEQQEYIKHINSIINNFFINIDKKYPEKNIKDDKEIDYDLYKICIEEYINDNNKQNENDFNNNGPFLLFINLISYIYLNQPFIKENINYCNFIKNKFLIKIGQNKNRLLNPDKNNNSIKVNVKGKIKNLNEINNSTRNKTNSNKILLTKVNTKQRSNSFHNSKIIKTKIKDKGDDRRLSNQLSDEELKILYNQKDNIKNHSDNNNNKYLAKNLKGQKEVRDFENEQVLYNYNSENNNEEFELITEEDINNKKEDEYSDIIYKFCEEENSKCIKKYYGYLRGKEILFFASKLKNELCSIWNISKTIIIVKDKMTIGKYTYYPIKFINYNSSFYMLYFEEQEKQKIFAKKCEEFTNFLKIDDFFEIKEKIGEGHFGLVKKCIEKSSGKEYAVKIMNKSKIKDKDLKYLIQERNYMCLIKHPNIVSLIKDFEDEKNIYFVMEYFKGGDLSKYLSKIKKKKEKNLEKIAAKIIKIIAQGVQFLNYFGIVHRDLKPENIVFGEEGDIKSIKIIDLGVAITLPYGKGSSTPIGTLGYIAPEMYTYNQYSYKVDVWSIGIILYYLVTGGVLPFDDENTDVLGKKVVFTHQEYPEKYFGDKSKSLINLIDKTLEKKPEKRITIHNFLNEDWVNKFSK